MILPASCTSRIWCRLPRSLGEARRLRRRLIVVIGLFVGIGGLPLNLLSDPTGAGLIAATKCGDLSGVQRYLELGISPDAHDRGRNTALIFAARDGHLEIVQVLIAAGATVNWMDGERVTPLILAAFKGHTAIVQLLLRHPADPMIRDQWERTALDYALRRGSAHPISILLLLRPPT